MNMSGLIPLEFNVIVRQKKAEEKTKGGLILTDDTVEADEFGATRGVLVAVSPLAFNEDIFPPDMEKPKVGATVLWPRGSGSMHIGNDGEKYRIIKDKDIVAIVEENDD